MRSATPNFGKGFEELVARVGVTYQHRGIMTLRKCEPPTIMIRGQWLRVDNPFPDFVGTWTERDGRAIFLECKTTKDARLGLLDEGGLTKAQYASLALWHASGAVSAVLWAYKVHVAFITASQIQNHVESAKANGKARCLKFEEIQSQFSISEIYNFVSAMRAYYDHEVEGVETTGVRKEEVKG